MSNVIDFPAPQGADAATVERFQVAFEFGAERALDLIDTLKSNGMDDTSEEMYGSLAGALHMLMWCALDCAPSREAAVRLISDAMKIAERKTDDST